MAGRTKGTLSNAAAPTIVRGMTGEQQPGAGLTGGGELPGWVLAIMSVLGWATMLAMMLASFYGFVQAMTVILTDGIMAMLVLVAAGGYGYAIFRLVAPEDTPRLLGLATGAALGLWLLSTAVLTLGSAVGGALSVHVWWPIIAAGVLLALVQAHRALGRAQIRPRLSGGSLVWVLAAVAAGIWLAGATMPPGWMGNLTADAYDVLEYHLQLPREYYHAGRVQTLTHNVYSHYPLGVEMLFLLGMCLRGGAYEGIYLAQMMGGLFAAVAVVGVFGGLRGTASEPGLAESFRARAAVPLLATAPWVIYLSWLAMAELGQICYLALALVWLRVWLRRPSARTAGWIGAMLGAACAVKYLSVGLIVAPAAAVMLAASLRSLRRMRQVAVAGALTLLLFSPWLIRNAAATGNPVFPLATSTFGNGHLSVESAQRWRDGHAPGQHPPVPAPPDYQPPERRISRAARFSAFLFERPLLGHPVLTWGFVFVLMGTIAAMVARPRGVAGWDWALLGVLAIQMVVWALFTRDMPARFVAVSVVPMSLLCAGGLARLACVREVRWLRQSAGLGGYWGLAPAGLLLLATSALNLGSAGKYYRASMAVWGKVEIPPAGVPGALFAEVSGYYRDANALGPQSRLMLIGEAKGFFFPAGTIYATVFDDHPFQEALAGGDPAGALSRAGVTHVFVAWPEISRLAETYGWPAEISAERLRQLFAGWPVVASQPPEETTKIFTLYAVPPPAGSGPGEAQSQDAPGPAGSPGLPPAGQGQ